MNTDDINIISNYETSINNTIIANDSVDNLKEEIVGKLANLQNFNIDELETPKRTINGPSLSTEIEEVNFRVSINENALTIDDPADSDKDFLLKECEIKLEPMAFAEFHDEYPEENIMNPGNYRLFYLRTLT